MTKVPDLLLAAAASLAVHTAALGALELGPVTLGARANEVSRAPLEITRLSAEQLGRILGDRSLPEPARPLEASRPSHSLAAPLARSAPRATVVAANSFVPEPPTRPARAGEREREPQLLHPPRTLPSCAAPPTGGAAVAGDAEVVDPSSASDLAGFVELVVRRVSARYPLRARRSGIEGDVLIGLEVGRSGEVSRVWCDESSGDASLDRAALDAIREWRLDPVAIERLACGRRFQQLVRFRLD